MIELPEELIRAKAYPHPVADITVRETPISWLLLTGQWVYKIKKPVCYPFVDYSTLARRQFYCHEELRLNRRFAPDVYLGVVGIGGSPGDLRIGGDTDITEYAVKMRQFQAGCLWRELAATGQLKETDVLFLAKTLADVQAKLPVAEADSGYGEPDTIEQWSMANFVEIGQQFDDAELQFRLDWLARWTERTGHELAAEFRQRKRSGFVREGHGDLHLGNLTRDQDKTVMFDALEFNPELRFIDVLSELAFPVMDLSAHRQNAQANLLLNAYLQQTGDYQGLDVFRYYQVYRAMVRAKVAALGQQREALKRYLDTAESFVPRHKPQLIVMMGFSGAGKSVVAQQLAQALDMIVLRSDVERKRLHGVPALSRGKVSKEMLYSSNSSAQMFARLETLAESLLRGGYSVIIDAAMLHVNRRQTFRALAERLELDGWLVHVTAPEDELVRRIELRQKHDDDPSDADVQVLHAQMRNWQPPEEWPAHRLLTIPGIDGKLEQITKTLQTDQVFLNIQEE